MPKFARLAALAIAGIVSCVVSSSSLSPAYAADPTVDKATYLAQITSSRPKPVLNTNARGGIAIQTLTGPVCPVESTRKPARFCTYRPVSTTVMIATEWHKVTMVTTDKNGRARVKLAPGTYLVYPHALSRSSCDASDARSCFMGQAPDPVKVEVTKRGFAQVRFLYDTGIR